MLILTTESVPGKKIKEVVGLVKGSTIRAKHIGCLLYTSRWIFKS